MERANNLTCTCDRVPPGRAQRASPMELTASRLEATRHNGPVRARLKTRDTDKCHHALVAKGEFYANSRVLGLNMNATP